MGLARAFPRMTPARLQEVAYMMTEAPIPNPTFI